MDYQFIQCQLDSRGVATLQLARPDVHNAFDDRMIAELNHALAALAQQPEVRVLVLRGQGKNFSAGADLGWMRAMAQKNYQENLDDAGQLALLMQQLNSFPAPTIALVQGAAFGGAVGLVACCDTALAGPSTSFCLSEVKIGLIPAVISPYVIRAIGERASRRYFTTAERFFAAEAQRLGLVSHLLSEEDMARCLAHAAVADTHASADDVLSQLVQTLLLNSPAAVKAAKALIAHVANQPLDAQLISETSRQIASIRVSQEGQEGLTAFLEKRTPAWQLPDSRNTRATTTEPSAGTSTDS